MTDYVELHAHSYFSLLDGSSSPATLVAQAAALGLPALALTDHDAVYGATTFVRAAQAAGVQPLLGAELTLDDGAHLTLLVESEQGWANLCTLITLGRAETAKGHCAVPWSALAEHHNGLIALSGCRRGHLARAVLAGDRARVTAVLATYQRIFGRAHYWVELQHHLHPTDQRLVRDLSALAEAHGLGMVVSNNVHYATRAEHRLHDVLVAIRHNQTLDALVDQLRTNSEYYLKAAPQLIPLFLDQREALHNTMRLAERCSFTPQYGLQVLPTVPTPNEMPALEYLATLCRVALPPHPSTTLTDRLSHELAIIGRAGLANYFLVVWDIVRFAREQGILCQGRGSAASSLVAYLLGISPVNPLTHDLVFERFLSDERQVVPDIDIDFDAARREEVIQYLYGKYGRAQAAMACTFVTFRTRSALRDVSKALGLPPAIAEGAVARLDGHWGKLEDVGDTLTDTLLELCHDLHGLPRHLGIHNGGMVITGDALHRRVPLEPATMPDRTVVQWDKDGLEDGGIVKIDILGLRMLSLLAEAQQLAGVDLATLTFDDPAVYAMLCAADTVGVFQVESRAQAQILPRLRPRRLQDLIVGISLIRPGPIQGDMVHPYLRRLAGEEPVTYPHPLVRSALAETLGVILYQEQVLKVARDLAGFTAGQGEQLRRALGAKHPPEAIAALRDQFLAGALAKGVDGSTAELVFQRLEAFGGYSFPKSHAAAFAVLVYRSAWLKHYHPLAFTVALLNHQPMGFWSPAVVVNDAQRHGVRVLPVDLGHSHHRCTIEGNALRLGFCYVPYFTEALSARLLAERMQSPFHNLTDLQRRLALPRRAAENLILCGALDSWGERRSLLWTLGVLEHAIGHFDTDMPPVPNLPPLSAAERDAYAYAVTGVSTTAHPLHPHRNHLRQAGLQSSSDLLRCHDGESVSAVGLLVMRQAPKTAKGHHFLTLEDEFGFINGIVRPNLYPTVRNTLRGAGVLILRGWVQHRDGVTNLLVSAVSTLEL